MEELLNVFLCRILLDLRVRVAAEHRVNRRDDIQHFCLRDEPIAIDVVQSKNPLQLLLDRASRYPGQDVQEVLQLFYSHQFDSVLS